jgi:hypothetical protein
LRAPPAKLHQDPPRFPPPPIYLPAAPHIALLSHTRSNARHSPVVFHFTATCPIARPTSSQVTPTSFSGRAYPHHCAPFAIPVIPVVVVPPSFPSRARHHRVQCCPTPSPPEGQGALVFIRSTTPQEGWEQALLDLPEGEGAPGFRFHFEPEVWSLHCPTNHYALLFPVV